MKAVNAELSLYWDIGRMTAERQEKAGWGRSVVENLSADLRREFPGVAGSIQNLRYMRSYIEIQWHERLQSLVGEIPAWTSQTLMDHSHLHGLIPAGALSSYETAWKIARARFVGGLPELSKYRYLMG